MCVTLIVIVLATLFPYGTGILVLLAVGILAAILANPFYDKQNKRIETVFTDNLNNE
jgi:hypothetical protein